VVKSQWSQHPLEEMQYTAKVNGRGGEYGWRGRFRGGQSVAVELPGL